MARKCDKGQLSRVWVVSKACKIDLRVDSRGDVLH